MPAPPPDLIAADRLLAAGDLDGAAAAYVRALAHDPAFPDAWFNRAWIARAMRRFDEALDAYAQAIAHGVARPEEAHLNRAVILADHLFRPAEAIAELDLALALAPGFVPALVSLGTIHEDLGDLNAARTAYTRAAAVEPGNGRAQARLAALALVAGEPAQAAAALTATLPLAPTADDRADMLVALGDAHDRLAHYDDAFAAYQAGAALAHSIAARRYDPAAQARAVDAQIATFQRAPSPTTDDDRPDPIFICGMFRSGSTLAERILGRHPLVTAGGELEVIPALAGSLAPYPAIVPTLPPERLAAMRQAYRAQAPAGGIVTDKRCDNVMHLGLVKALFPRARIVHTVRTPLDNILSVYCLRFGEGVTYGDDLAEIAHYYLQYRRMMAHWRRLFPDAIHDLSYDALVARPTATVDALLDGLGLPRHPACLAPEPDGGAVRTASTWAVRQPIHAASSGRWRHYARQLVGVRATLAAAGVDPVSPP